MLVLTAEDKQKLDEFYSACDDLIGGKFILSNLKITTILKTIASSDLLYNLFSKCMNGFNFTNEFKLATNDLVLKMPESREKTLAFVFCLLLQIDNKKMDLQRFVKEHFDSPDGYNVSYANFAKVVLIPFKEYVKEIIEEMQEDKPQEPVQNTTPVEPEERSREDLTLDKIDDYVYELEELLKQDTRLKKDVRENLQVTLAAMHEAVDLSNFVIINALTIPLELCLKKSKSMQRVFMNIKAVLYNYYYA